MNEFPNLKNATNLKILKCFTTLFTKDGLKLNIGSYILLFIILVTLVCLIIFIIKGYELIINIIDKIENKNNINILKKRKRKNI